LIDPNRTKESPGLGTFAAPIQIIPTVIDNTVFEWQIYAIIRISTNQRRALGIALRYGF
jgi:hypothetical protein